MSKKHKYLFHRQGKIVALRYKKICLISLLVKLEIQIKTIVKYHFVVTRVGKIKNLAIIKCWRGYQWDFLYTATASESVNRYNYLIK